jgi:hypothetical protein
MIGKSASTARSAGLLHLAVATFAVAAVAVVCTGSSRGAEASSIGDGAYPGSPPAFVTPAGGSAQVRPNAFGGSTTTLLRSNGSVFAIRESDDRGRPMSTVFNLDDGTGIEVDADYGEQAAGASPAFLTRTPRGHRNARRFLASCGADDENPSSFKWFSTLNWYWVASSTPGYLDRTNTLASLRNGHTEWVNNVTWCSTIPDVSSFNTLYQGTISAVFGQNGYNTIGWGSVADLHLSACPSGTIACTNTWFSGITATESDTRFDDTGIATWFNGAALGKYDVHSTMAHELGHSAGFGHVACYSNVMCQTRRTNDVSDRQLGKGDANENNAKY